MDIKGKSVKNILVSVRERTNSSLLLSLGRTAAKHIAVFGIAILLSRVEFTSGIFPFGLALVIGVPDTYSIAALIGYVVNNWIGETIVGANSAYIGAVGVVAALRWILAGMQRGRYKKNNYVPCLVAGLLSVTITEIIILALTSTFSFASVTHLLGGVALAGGFSYFYHISFDALKRRKSIFEMSSTQKASLALSLCTLLMAMYGIHLGPFSLGRLCGTVLVIFAAFLLGTSLDAAVFASVAAAIALCEPRFIFAGVGICIGGVLCALFKKRGKALMCLVYILSASVFAVCAENYVYALTYISEVLFGALVFLIVPVKSATDARFDRLSESLTSATAAIGVKLDSISSSMRDITSLLDRTVRVKDERRSMEELYSRAVEKVCRRCARAAYCWTNHYGDTTDALYKLTPALIEKGAVTREDFNAPFSERCVNMPGLAAVISDQYADYVDSLTRVKNTQLYKDMLKKQFMAVCDMLDGAKEELCAYRNWDENKSKRVYDCAVRLQLPVETAGCVFDSAGRPVVTVTLRDIPPDTQIRRLTAGVSLIVGATLSKPAIEQTASGTVLCFTERPVYNISTATTQVCADGKVCGDVYSVFTDIKGNAHMILSDGMGTGIKAAREGAVCCAFLKRLLETGFSIKRAAELANSALGLREDNEAASTLDALSFNVYDGSARLFKAGAAPTYCLRGSKILRFAGRSLPVGILDEVVCKEYETPITDGDIVVMTSDGIQENGYRIIEECLKNSFAATPEELCREIMSRTQELGGLRDDVTVMVAKVSRHAED